MHAAAEVKIIQTEARVEGIYSVLFGMIPNKLQLPTTNPITSKN